MKNILMLAVLVTLLSACAETVDDIDAKAVARWQALIDNDYEKAYQYIAPSYRELENLMTYQMRIQKAQLNIQWNDVEFLDKECNEESCNVKLNINYTYQFSRRAFGEATAGTRIEESWIKDGGTWYYLPKKSIEL
jgi:hypothetical protein